MRSSASFARLASISARRRSDTVRSDMADCVQLGFVVVSETRLQIQTGAFDDRHVIGADGFGNFSSSQVDLIFDGTT